MQFKYFILMSLVAFIALITGCQYCISCINGGGVQGSGNVVSETRTVDKFHSIKMTVSGTVYVTQNTTSLLQLEAEDNIMPLLRTYVQDGILIVDSEKSFSTTKSINIYVNMAEIKSLVVSGSADIIGKSEVVSDDLKIAITGSGNMKLQINAKQLHSKISGSGNICLKGNTLSHIAVISGSGNLKAADLVSEKSTVQISGSGNGKINISEELNAEISGSGNIYYKGNPKIVNQQITGSGEIRKVD